MPLNFTASHSSRITKRSPARRPLLRHESSSTGGSRARKSQARSQDDDLQDGRRADEGRLDNRGRVNIMLVDGNLKNVLEAMHYVRSHMFDALPDAGGFNSTRIAEILNFRARLAPVITKSHLHALLVSPTSTEREVARLIRAGQLQRFDVTGRGSGASVIGQNLALMEDIKALLERSDNVGPSLAAKFIEHLERGTIRDSLNAREYSTTDIDNLMRGGFLVSRSSGLHTFGSYDEGDKASLTSVSSVSNAASGSLAAVGGRDAVLNAGGSSRQRLASQLRTGSNYNMLNASGLQLSLPGTGAFLSLIAAARSHLLLIVRKTRFKEIPVYLLKERWDGGIPSDDLASKAKGHRGNFAGVLPAKTRKWKAFYGISFEWVLAECVGANLMEQFDTGSVGRAVRLV